MPRIRRDDIIDVTLRQGLDVASTTTVARELGVTQPAIYRHIASKAALLDLAADRALLPLAGWQSSGPWGTAAAAFLDVLWDLLDAHRGLAGYLLGHSALPETLQGAAARLVGAGAHEGVDIRRAILATDAIVHLACLAHVGADRLREQGAAWDERAAHLADPLAAAVRAVRATDARALAHEQCALVIAGVRT